MAMDPEVIGRPAYLAACKTASGFAAVGLDGGGSLLWRRELMGRAHDIVADPAQKFCAVMGRKPGRYAEICDLASGMTTTSLAPAPGNHFDGHAVFSDDGGVLFTTQSAEQTHAGMIVAYRTADGTRIQTHESGGTEPHEIIWAAPGRLAIAHGGIVDRHDPDGIDSSLVLMDAGSGEILRHWVLDDEWESLSIRHLAKLPSTRIAFAMQDQDAATERRPLIGIAGETGLEFLEIPAALQPKLDGYIGSVAADSDGAILAATAPRGGVTMFWSVVDKRFLGHVSMADVCGLAAAGSGCFYLTTGHGGQAIVSIDPATGILTPRNLATATGLQWDNHLARVGG